MPLKVTFELSDSDLRHFRKVMRQARSAAKNTPEKKTAKAARKLLDKIRESSMPDFVRERLLHIDKLLAMLDDPDWALSGENRNRIVSALAYFNEPVDLIPDSVPGIGYLDDAIMVQLVVDELQPDIEAYDDFCEFRKQLDRGRKPVKRNPDKQASLDVRRTQLHGRMRRRRTRRRQRAGSSRTSMKPFSLW